MSVCVSVRGHMPTLLHGPGCNLGKGRGAPSCASLGNLQSVHRFRCHDNIAPRILAIGADDSREANAQCQRVNARACSRPGFPSVTLSIDI